MATYLLTNNPSKWDVDAGTLARWIEQTREGETVPDRWSTGSRTSGIEPGDRAFLLRQGLEPRGIFMAGIFISEVYTAAHWDGSGRMANFADVEWDTVLDPGDSLHLADLVEQIPQAHWTPQTSGTRIPDAAAARLEELWSDHVGSVRSIGDGNASHESPRKSGQGRQLDAGLRSEIENLAQDRLTAHYRAQGWTVEDMRYGNSFDARATRDGDVLFLEAKGTTTAGESVIVTPGEVRFARANPGRCIMGVLSDIDVDAAGHVVASSGTLRIIDWNPDAGHLEPLSFSFFPPY